VEVQLLTPPEECARRDPKGLYAAARAGRAPGLPGEGVAYEPATAPEVIARDGEDAEAEVDMNVVMTGEGRFVEVQGTAEKVPFRKSDLGRLLGLAERGVGQLLEIQASRLSGS